MKQYNNPNPDDEHKFKTCKKCKSTKSLFDFPFSNKSQNKYRADCRMCRNEKLKNEYWMRKLPRDI
jgi:hypothetical protein